MANSGLLNNLLKTYIKRLHLHYGLLYGYCERKQIWRPAAQKAGRCL
jgi:hypothetical protein